MFLSIWLLNRFGGALWNVVSCWRDKTTICPTLSNNQEIKKRKSYKDEFCWYGFLTSLIIWILAQEKKCWFHFQRTPIFHILWQELSQTDQKWSQILRPFIRKPSIESVAHIFDKWISKTTIVGAWNDKVKAKKFACDKPKITSRQKHQNIVQSNVLNVEVRQKFQLLCLSAISVKNLKLTTQIIISK